MTSTVSSEVLQALRNLDTCTVSNAIEGFEVRLRNEGYTDPSIRCLIPRRDSLVGYAVTCRFRTSGPPPKDHRYLDRTDWWNYLLTIPAPRVAVFEDVDPIPGRGAIIGEVHSNVLVALEAAGAVTNGAIRDLGGIEPLNFHVFAGNTTVSHAYAHMIDFGKAVEVGGMRVLPGDLIHGDRHGVQTIPLEIAEQVPAAAARNCHGEESVIRLCTSGNFTLERLRGLVAELG